MELRSTLKLLTHNKFYHQLCVLGVSFMCEIIFMWLLTSINVIGFRWGKRLFTKSVIMTLTVNKKTKKTYEHCMGEIDINLKSIFWCLSWDWSSVEALRCDLSKICPRSSSWLENVFLFFCGCIESGTCHIGPWPTAALPSGLEARQEIAVFPRSVQCPRLLGIPVLRILSSGRRVWPSRHRTLQQGREIAYIHPSCILICSPRSHRRPLFLWNPKTSPKTHRWRSPLCRRTTLAWLAEWLFRWSCSRRRRRRS